MELCSEAATIRFWGVRGSIPSPGPDTVFYGGNTSCVELRAQGQILILDAGTGIRALGRALLSEFQGRSIEATLLISHTHWDHIQGFPFFQPAYQRHSRITVLGYEGARQGLQNALSVQMDSPYFPIALGEMPASVAITEMNRLQFKVGPLDVEAQLLNHPGICTGYRIRTPGGDVCYLPDVELCPRHRKTHLNVKWEHEEGLDERIQDFIRNAAVVIMDSQYTTEEYSRHAGWGHSCVDDTVEAAIRANVRHLYLFHHDPDRADDQVDAMLDHARHMVSAHFSSLTVEAAREGVSLELTPAAQTVMA